MKMITESVPKARLLIKSTYQEKLMTLLQVIAGSLFIGLCAQIKIPLFFTPVPLTGQTFGVILVGVVLGSRKGALASLCYLMEGMAGLPVWAGGASGLLHLLGPTGGYRFAYPLQAFLAGYCVQTFSRSSVKVFIALALTCALEVALGSLWLGYFVGWSRCFALGFVPFIWMELFKVALISTGIRVCR